MNPTLKKQLAWLGATSDSDRMLQIGINVMPEAEGMGGIVL